VYFLEFQNERQRLGSWVALTRESGLRQLFHRMGSSLPGAGRSRAAQRLVCPCAHVTGDLTGDRGVNNKADLYTAVYRHSIGDGLTVYTNYAMTINDRYAH
jgi:hypothetical protein